MNPGADLAPIAPDPRGMLRVLQSECPAAPLTRCSQSPPRLAAQVTEMCSLGSSSYSCSSLKGDQVSTALATYSSWECGSEAGTYLAVGKLTTISADGKAVETEFCEYGTWEEGTGINAWCARFLSLSLRTCTAGSAAAWQRCSPACQWRRPHSAGDQFSPWFIDGVCPPLPRACRATSETECPTKTDTNAKYTE